MTFWHDKHVLITGASSGIGWALAEHLARRGAAVGLTARREDRLRALAEQIRQSGGRAAFAAADVTDGKQVVAACGTLERTLGPCDVLIANAGVARPTPGERFSAADANLVFSTNVLGVSNSIAAVLPGMVERKRGHLVAIASIAAMMGLPNSGAYSASKAAVVTLMESLRVDLYRKGVKVTTICPGFVETPLLDGYPREVLPAMMSAERAARIITRAVERGRGKVWFPFRTWALARIARALPFFLYRRVCARLPKHNYEPRVDQ